MTAPAKICSPSCFQQSFNIFTFTIGVRSSSDMWPLLRSLLLAVAAASFASANTFYVNSTKCTGPGSVMEAVKQANTNPGPDTITFTPGIKIDVDDSSCQININGLDPGDYYMFKVNESVTFDGNGALLQGVIYWIDLNGRMSMTACPSRNPQIRLVAATAGFLRVGQINSDNSGINVVVRNLGMTQVSAIVDVQERATVEFYNVTATKVYDFIRSCDRSPILARRDSNLTVSGCTFKDVRTWPAYNDINGGSAMILADRTSKLYVVGTKIFFCKSQYAIRWNAAAGRSANIVSCQIELSDGIAIFGEAGAIANIVNTAIVLDTDASSSFLEFKRILVSAATAKVQASTVIAGQTKCISQEGCTLLSVPLDVVDSGMLVLEQTAVNVVYPYIAPREILLAMLQGGTCNADAYTWMQPVASQNSSVLKTLCNQPGLLTDPPALLQACFDCDIVADYITPLLGNSTAPGVLIDAVPGNVPLLDPQTGNNITVDALGNPRYDGNGMRDIGAVQLWLAPTVQVTAVNDSRVRLSWTTAGPPYDQGYQLYYKPVGTATWFKWGSSSSVRTAEVTGLTNGVEYEFKVNGVNGGLQEGPDSNVVSATPLGPFTAPSGITTSPPPGPSTINLCWTPPSTGGRTIEGYYVFYQSVGSNSLQSLPLTTSTCAIISNLTPATAYSVCVGAVSTNGDISETGCVPSPIMTATCSVGGWSMRVSETGTSALHTTNGH